MKTNTERWGSLIFCLTVPLIYFLMYLPIWNGKELLLANSGKIGIIFFVYQCICLVFAILRLSFAKLRNADSCLGISVSAFFSFTSLAITLFVGYFFLLELFGFPSFPAQR